MAYISEELNTITTEIDLDLGWMEVKNALGESSEIASCDDLRQLITKLIDDIDVLAPREFKKIASQTVGKWVENLPANTIKGVNPVINEERINIMLKEIKEQYILQDVESVCNMILSITDMAEFLLDAATEIRKRFGPDVEISLNVEGTGISEEPFLYARVFTNLPVNDALNKVDEIDREWLLDNLNRVQGRFNFDVDWK